VLIDDRAGPRMRQTDHEAAVGDPAACARPGRGHLAPVLLVAVAVALVLPIADLRLPELPSFVPVLLAVVCCFDILSVVLLTAQFRDSGELRALALSWAYAFSLIVLLGWAAAFPGVLGTPAPIGSVPSTAPWLWVVWHTAFPVLLAAALAPWPGRADRPVPPARRASLALATVAGSVLAGAFVVAGVVTAADSLPQVISGTDTSAMTAVAGPLMLPVVVLATLVACAGGWRRGGAQRWAALAAVVSLADVVLTLLSYHRFSLGWYAGRTMTIIAAGVVLVALLGEFSQVKRRLAQEGERLRVVLARTDELERVQATLITHMAEGVLMQDRNGSVVASNPAAQRLLGWAGEQLQDVAPTDRRWRLVRADGATWTAAETPSMTALRTGVGQQDQIVGVHLPGGVLRWLSVNASPARNAAGAVDYVVTSMTDVTAQHSQVLYAAHEDQERRARIQRVLDAGGPSMVFQPIVSLNGGVVVGHEALARFPAGPGETSQPPNRWFDDAREVGLGIALELSAIRAALASLDRLPGGTYLSVNAGPDTVATEELAELLRTTSAERIVLELTEHVGIEDYTALGTALARLAITGVRLAVDDAGAGFASLRHILTLKPDIMKLDIALVRGIDQDPARRALAGSLLSFGAEIGAHVVAEGIETAAEQDVLRLLGVEYGQGYHLGRPAPLGSPSRDDVSPRPAPLLSATG